jgi:hypothetical protein
MRRHKRLYPRLFRKTYRYRANQHREYLRNRKKMRVRQAQRALRTAERPVESGHLSPMRATEWGRDDGFISLEAMAGPR